MQFKKAAVVCAVVCASLMLSVAAKASDPQSGTWKLNAGKSLYSPGPAPKSITLTVQAEEKSIKIHSEGIDGAGKPTKVDFTANFDGKDYPHTGPNVLSGYVSSARYTGDHAIELTDKINGSLLRTRQLEVSSDSKTLTITIHIPNRAEPDIQVFDRQ